MSRRAWAILIGVVALVIVVGVVVAVLVANQPDADAGPTPTPTVSDSPSPSPTPEPTSSLAPAPPAVLATCETTSTAEFQAMMAQNGWISWETQNEDIGARPFDRFPEGAPDGQIVCRWGVSPDLATDNVVDLAWSPIEPDAAASAQSYLLTEGYQRIDAPEGVYFALTGTDFHSDAEGYGETYLFTDDDVRWALTKADVAYVKAPDEEG